MRLVVPRERPTTWREQRAAIKHRWTVPFAALEWSLDWLAHVLSNWKFLEVLEYLSSLSILVAAIFYFSESGDRLQQKHYQAWQVINTAQGKGGSGGRVDALQQLNSDRIPLVGVDVSGAFLQGIQLSGARLVRANFSAADVRNSNFSFADFADADLHSANFRYSNFRKARLQRVQLDDADLVGADLSSADLSGATLANADLRNANLASLIGWHDIAAIKQANIYGAKNPPAGFVAWAIQNDAVQTPDEPDAPPPADSTSGPDLNPAPDSNPK
ncbi:MAG: pentapeptide repeat-containing protein [Candidatus Acidiferrales bacterium]